VFSHIYDGAALAANPAAAKPVVTIDFRRDQTFCEAATKKPVRRPHMLFFNKNQITRSSPSLSGHALMDAKTRKPRRVCRWGRSCAWPTPDQKMAIARR
jgi:hypothetical protein